MRSFKTKPAAEWKVFPGSRSSQAALMTLKPGDVEGGPGNRHRGDQWLFVISGRGRAIVKKNSVRLNPGSLLFIKAGETHEIKALGRRPLKTINVYAPPSY
jgi:mannose-6-phosphate isomerase-like protein (cupin superfamily)